VTEKSIGIEIEMEIAIGVSTEAVIEKKIETFQSR